MHNVRKLNTLIIGSGGREHALGWKIAQSPMAGNIFFAPGNGGTENIGTNIAVETNDIVRWTKNEGIDFVVIGPEAPLANGLANKLQNAGIACFGPSKEAAQLESSKAWACKFMERHNIPHPQSFSYTMPNDALDALNHSMWQKDVTNLVIKADGLAGGKGVYLPNSKNDAIQIITNLMLYGSLGDSGKQIVIQERLIGPEISIFVLCDGTNTLLLPPMQDHKRLLNGDHGPNTGGMGAYGPVPFVKQSILDRIRNEIIKPTIAGMHTEGKPYRGLLYVGLMLTSEGPKVIEFNVRFGDPETQPLMLLLNDDLLPLLFDCAQGKLTSKEVKIKDRTAVAVVLATKEYPNGASTNTQIHIPPTDHLSDLEIFHSGTQQKTSQLTITGGRVVCVTAHRESFFEAQKAVYSFISSWNPPLQYRTDIGYQYSLDPTKLY